MISGTYVIFIMKTKFLRFNKHLPRIDTLHPKTSQHNAESSPFRTPAKTPDMQELLEAIIRKTKTAESSYELEPRDRNVVVELPNQIEETQEISLERLKSWISEVCTKVVSGAFNLLLSDQLSYDQAKVFCSQGILRNIVLLVEKYQLTCEEIRQINSHIEVNVVPYLKRKYPMTESSDINKSLDEAVKPIDKTDALQNDLLYKSGVIFTFKEDGNYNATIMEFLNWLMQQIDTKETDESPKTVYEQFYDYMVSTFSKVYNEQWMNKTRESMLKDNSRGDVLKPGPGLDFSKTEVNEDVIINEKYAEQVKDYTHFIIGRKISKNVPTYNEEELEEGHLSIKSPAVLRILTKWCEQLWSKFDKKNYFLDREENLRVQEKGGNINTMFMWMKMPLNDMIETEKQEIETFMKEILTNNFDQQTQLLKQELNENDGFYHIDRIEKVCGKFATKTVSNLHSYIVIYLNRLIHGLLKVSKQLYEERLSTKARWTSPPDLLTFKVGDLMRCKCSSKERQILHIYKELESISKSQPKLLKIIRVKNRLKLGTNDILINILYKNKYLCQIQLAVKSAQSKFISCSNAWNHYIYELGRTIFGPITELSSVWISLDPRSAQYAHVILNERPRKVGSDQACIGQSRKHDLKRYERPFICSKCKICYSHSNYFWSHMKCDYLGCGFVICATCRIDDEKEQTLKQKLLGDNQVLLNAAGDIVNRKSQAEQRLPNFGICIPISSKQIKIRQFKKIEYRKIMTIFGLQTDRKGKQKVIKIDELIKKNAERKFLKKYLVFQIHPDIGKNLINITLDRAKKEYIIPAKVKEVYKKQKEIMSLIEENLDDESIKIIGGKPQGMNHIKNLQLADNKLTNIDFIVKSFQKLDRLQLSRNVISKIEGVSQLKYLVKLNLRNNKLQSLPDEITKLYGLKGLNIRHNKLTALPQDFGNLTLLQKLQSDNNLLTELPSTFQQLTKLTFIDFSSNKLTQFPKSIQNFPALKELALAKNKLGRLPEWIGNFKHCLQTLNLTKAALQNLPQGIYSLNKLQVLKIQSFHDHLSPQIGQIKTLRELSIQMKNMKELPNEIFNLTQLELLELEDCPIKVLPDCLSEMTKLQSFGLINNKLTQVPNELGQMVNLRNLKLEGQNFDQMPAVLKNLSNLRTLSLNNNKLVDFPAVVLHLNKLYSLKLKKTQLKNIPDDLFKHLPDLEELDIEENDLTTLPLSLAASKKLTEKKLKYDKHKISVPAELKMVFQAFQAGLQDEPFFSRSTTLTFSHIFSRPSLD